jgi:uncharacterized protein YabN with tetrapyrrole methylase and pyrophosphatase domain
MNKDEVEEIFEVPLSFLMDQHSVKNERRIYDQIEWTVYSYRLLRSFDLGFDRSNFEKIFRRNCFGPMKKLHKVTNQLRDPKTGCPWDKEQSFESIAGCTIEEAYEVVEAIDNKDYESLKDELGDLLFQVSFHSQIAEEMGLFTLDDVIDSVTEKLIRRHPHVFSGKNDQQLRRTNG